MSSNSVVGTLARVSIAAESGGSGSGDNVNINPTPVYYTVSTVLTSSDYNKRVIANQADNTHITFTLPDASAAPDGTQIQITCIVPGGRVTITPMWQTYIIGQDDVVTLIKIQSTWTILNEMMVPISFRSKMNDFSTSSFSYYQSDTIIFQNGDIVTNIGTQNEQIEPSHPGVYKLSLNSTMSSSSIGTYNNLTFENQTGVGFELQAQSITHVNTSISFSAGYLFKRTLTTFIKFGFQTVSGSASYNNIFLTVTRVSIA